MLFKLEKPNLSKISKEEISKAFTNENQSKILDFIKMSAESNFLYWDKIRLNSELVLNL